MEDKEKIKKEEKSREQGAKEKPATESHIKLYFNENKSSLLLILFSTILIGYFFLKERVTLTKIISIILVVVGIVGLKLV